MTSTRTLFQEPVPDPDYAIGICPQTPCQSDLHVWSSSKPQDEHLCHCGWKSWSTVTLAEGVNPTPVQPFDRHDLKALRAAMDLAPFTLADLTAALTRSPKSMASLIKTVDAR